MSGGRHAGVQLTPVAQRSESGIAAHIGRCPPPPPRAPPGVLPGGAPCSRVSELRGTLAGMVYKVL